MNGHDLIRPPIEEYNLFDGCSSEVHDEFPFVLRHKLRVLDSNLDDWVLKWTVKDSVELSGKLAIRVDAEEDEQLQHIVEDN